MNSCGDMRCDETLLIQQEIVCASCCSSENTQLEKDTEVALKSIIKWINNYNDLIVTITSDSDLNLTIYRQGLIYTMHT